VAGIGSGPWGYYTVNGVNYKNISVVTTSSAGSAWAFAETDVVPTNRAVTTGWISANARLFDASGNLVLESGFQTNPGTIRANGVWDVFSPYRNATGSFRSWGVSKAWNGATYIAYYASQSSLLSTGT